ncbi:hypothetical protein SCANM63S_07913 [Streptomyces canarius]
MPWSTTNTTLAPKTHFRSTLRDFDAGRRTGFPAGEPRPSVDSLQAGQLMAPVAG